MVPNRAKRWLGKDFDTTQTMVDRSHFTWVGPYCPALERSRDPEFLKRSEELVRRMGYEFQITEVVHPRELQSKQPVEFLLKAKNVGVAPFYYPWSVEWALIDSSGKVAQIQAMDWDIRNWLPGPFAEDAKFTFDVPAGDYRVGLGIRDPWLDRPAIGFANDLPVVDGWTILSEIKVTH
jgi:hypothetical protein